ncbi:MAG: phosphoglycerate mutase (2,3-diphosphoglycerate-independent) [Candidatus Hodarchaeales archaeon]|jgi:2,3-bisphosphoglycerate-independent phosphoglycerate mutase
MKQKYDTPLAQAISEAYKLGQDDEIIEPIIIIDDKKRFNGKIRVNDGVIFANIRGEREIELTQALTEKEFSHFPTEKLDLNMSTMIEYHPKLSVNIAFPPTGKLKNNLTEFLSFHKKRIIKIVESEKAIHLTFFFNGKQHIQYEMEDRIIIPSYDTGNLADHPEMKALEVANATISTMREKKHDLVITNLSPCDVMGHIENKSIIKEAIHTVDNQLARIIDSANMEGYITLITADHGLAESWLYPDGSIDTGHTSSPVPFLLVTPYNIKVELRKNGSLVDIAPTILHIFGLEQPQEMGGKSLLLETKKFSFNNPKILLLILDGWGYNTNSYGNLFMEFHTPKMDFFQNKYPFTTLIASGLPLGMPEGTVGNSEIGHLHMGVGCRVVSDRVRIFDSIANGSFFKNPAFMKTMKHVKEHNKNLHLIGIISFYSSHGSINYLEALMDLAKQQEIQNVFIHGMLGRRGEKPEAGAFYVNKLEQRAKILGNVEVASIIGRHWSLDREENWDRIQKTYNMLVLGTGKEIFG